MTDNTPTTKQDEGGLLLPCPFCGTGPSDDHEAVQVQVYHVGLSRSAVVHCEKCGIETHMAESSEAAITAWNTRAPATPPHNEDGLRKALEDVINPLGYLQRKADEEGSRLSGSAYSIANDLGFVQSIARQALGDIPSG